MSKRLGYALDLTPPWRVASCPFADPTRTTLPIVEQFTNVSSLVEELGHVGAGPNDRIEVYAFPNPERHSAAEFARSERLPGPVPGGDEPALEGVTFAGRAAAQATYADYPYTYHLLVPDGERMLVIVARLAGTATDISPLLAVIRTFRFLSPAETAALPAATPMPAGGATPQALAGALATAFQQKDIAALGRLLSPCVMQGVQNGGGSAITRDSFIAGLRTQFANGLTVTVDTSTVTTDGFGPGTATVRSRWNAPPPMSPQSPPPVSGQTQNVSLLLQPTAGGFYWSGTILLPP